MAFIFGNSPGVIGAIVTGDALPFVVTMGGNGLVPDFPAFMLAKAVLTSFSIDSQSGLQVAHTLRDRIYAYVFGERAADAVIGGIAFADVCPAVPGTWVGFDAVYAYYEAVRASSQGAVVRLVFGPNTSLAGMMSGLRFSLIDAGTGVGEFGFKFKVFPRGISGPLPPLPWKGSNDLVTFNQTSLTTNP